MAIQDESNAVKLPIPSKALRFAQQVSEPYDDQTIRQRVFFNAIAVAIVHNFFEILGVSTNYQESDLTNPHLQWAADSSSLTYDTLGQLECRGLPTGNSVFSVPYETWEDRIGYLFVGVDLHERTATLHGFLTTVHQVQVEIAEMESIESMIHHLHALPQSEHPALHICLSDWFKGVFQPGWETLEAIMTFPGAKTGWAFRGVVSPDVPSQKEAVTDEQIVRRAKVLQWTRTLKSVNAGVLDLPEPVVLVVEIHRQETLVVHVAIQMHPFHQGPCLPANMTLKIIDETKTTILQASSRPIDNYLRFPFRGHIGENFQVNITLNEFEINEYFQI